MSRTTEHHNVVIPVALDLLVAIGATLSARFPVVGGAMAGVGVSLWVFFPDLPPSFGILGALIVVLAAVTRGRTRLALGLTAWYLVAMATAIGTWTSASLQRMAVNLVSLVGIYAVAWTMGLIVLALRRRAERTERLSVEQLRQQRLSLAQDLHDTIAQAIAGIVLKAEVVAGDLPADTDPKTMDDLRTLRGLGRQALGDLRNMMEVLRREQVGLGEAPAWQVPGARTVLDEQLARLNKAGFITSCVVEGDLSPLPSPIQTWLSKLTIEAASNMIRHGRPGGHCSIMVEVQPDMVEAVFTNPIRVPRKDGSAQAEGLGLIGARERSEAMGGEMETLTHNDRWVLRARVPMGLR